MPKKTDLGNRIVSTIQTRPAVTRGELGELLHVSYAAIQKQLRRLHSQGMVKPSFVVTKEWARGRRRFWIFIETRPVGATDIDRDYQSELCGRISKEIRNRFTNLSLSDCEILIGADSDIVLTLFAEDFDAVGSFVTRYLRILPEVVRTRTAWSQSVTNEPTEEMRGLGRAPKTKRRS